MKASFVPPLRHLASARLVVSLFNHLEVQKDFRRKKYRETINQVTETISHLTPCVRLQQQLETFIDPLIREIENWLKVFEQNWYGYDGVFRAIMDTLPGCWLSDGTIDREKSMKSLVRNEDLRPINRFIFACTYCFFDEVLYLWKVLFKIERAYLRHKSTPLVKHWVEWLESSSNKDWEFFVAWTLETSLWNSNLFILKHALGTLSPAEKSQYLLKALIGKEVTSDVMRFCMSVMTKDEQEQIFREAPVEVFRCISSWPWRSIFYDIIDDVQPHLTEETFCGILDMIFGRIKRQDRGCVQLVELLQNFWTQSPRNLRSIAQNDPRFSKPLQFLLDFDVSQVFPKRQFLECFLTDFPNMMFPRPQPVLRRRRRRGVRRRYRNIF